jgi:hypothetical protein
MPSSKPTQVIPVRPWPWHRSRTRGHPEYRWTSGIETTTGPLGQGWRRVSEWRSRASGGVLICGSRVGACVAANKLAGVRAAIGHDSYSAHQGVEHDNMNVLVLGGRIVGPALPHDLVRIFVDARYTADPRHVRRLAKVTALERCYRNGPA